MRGNVPTRGYPISAIPYYSAQPWPHRFGCAPMHGQFTARNTAWVDQLYPPCINEILIYRTRRQPQWRCCGLATGFFPSVSGCIW